MADIVIGDVTGAFTQLMTDVEARINAQFTAGRITGEDFATVYLGGLQVVLQQAVLFALQTPKVDAEVLLLEQKTATELAQIEDTVVATSAPVEGVVGAQKSLYAAQTDGFARDAEQKVLKTLLDTWNIQRTTDDTLTPPTGLADTSLNAVITKAKAGIDVT